MPRIKIIGFGTGGIIMRMRIKEVLSNVPGREDVVIDEDEKSRVTNLDGEDAPFIMIASTPGEGTSVIATIYDAFPEIDIEEITLTRFRAGKK